MVAPNSNSPAFCSACGSPLTAEAAFCTACGAPVRRPGSTQATNPGQQPNGANRSASRYAASDAADAAATMAYLHSDDGPAHRETPTLGYAPPNKTLTMPAQRRAYGDNPNFAGGSPLYMGAPEPKKPSKTPAIVAGVLAAAAVAGAVIGFVVVPAIGGSVNNAQSTSTDGASTASPDQNEGGAASKSTADESAGNSQSEDDATKAGATPLEPQKQQTEDAAKSYKLPESNSRYYTEAELAALSDYDLYLARNEIYARHGRMFKNDDLNQYFNGTDWYHGTVAPENFNENVLNDYEKKNIELMRQVESSRNSPYL